MWSVYSHLLSLAVSVAYRHLCHKVGSGAILKALISAPLLDDAFPAMAGHAACSPSIYISAASVLTFMTTLFLTLLLRATRLSLC